MGPLRLMTFNVQMLPWIADVVGGTTNDAPERADRVADAIFALPTWDWPDVIALNEVFDEDGREKLLARLSGTWPHVIKKIHDGGVEEDSGLMLFSRVAFLPLATGGNLLERFFSDAEGADAMSSKGVGLVQIDTPVERTTIAFTHMQASYLAEDEHRAARVGQLGTIHAALDELLGPFGAAWQRAIVIGDLNIRGDSAAQTDEWATVFDNHGTDLTRVMYDGWRTSMHPPGDPSDYDPGVSHLEWANGKAERLDYHLFGNESDEALVPHHMHQRIRNSSDHTSLESVVQFVSPHCQPKTAVELRTVPPSAGGDAGKPSTVQVVPLELRHPGTFQWVYVDRPGTYSVWGAADLEIRLFAQSDLSDPLELDDTLVIAELEPSLAAGFSDARVAPKGSTYAAPEPFFIAIRSRQAQVGPRTLAVLEHHGESQATAIVLAPHLEIPSGFPAGQRLGDDDRCWFKAVLPQTYAGKPHGETFRVANPGQRQCEITVLDAGLGRLESAAGQAATGDVAHTTTGGETVFLTLTRAGVQDTGFTVTWLSPVSYLMLERPLGVFINDETGTDFVGDDEIELTITMDDVPLFDGSWDDADTGERWPGLAEAIAARSATKLSGTRRVGFTGDIMVSYIEVDMNAAGWQTVIVAPLSPGEKEVMERRANMPVHDAVSDGRYTFFCSLSRTR
jgi:hypothetical protein